MSRDPRAEEIVDAVLDGSRAGDGEVDELRRVAQRLERAGADEVDRLMRAGVDPELEARAREHLRRLMEGQGDARPAPVRRLRTWAVLVAAAATVVVWIAVWRGRDAPAGDGPAQVLSNGARVEALAPHGEVTAYGTFRWSGPALPAGAVWIVRVFDAKDEAEPPLETSVEEARWTPDDESELPDRIRWEVEAVGASGEPLGWDEASASRSPSR